jgi:hypothetical protein
MEVAQLATTGTARYAHLQDSIRDKTGTAIYYRPPIRAVITDVTIIMVASAIAIVQSVGSGTMLHSSV